MFLQADDPGIALFRRMVALSVGLHAAALLAGAVWTGLARPPARLAPVAVVDLVGGGPAAEAARPSREPEPAPARRGREAVKSREKSREKDRALKAGKAKAPPKAAPPPAPAPVPKEEARPAPPADTLAERIRRIREARQDHDRVQEAVRNVGREVEARRAVGGVRERVARRVEPPALPAAKAAEGALPGSGAGGKRVSPEDLAYFRALDEKVRSNWSVPDHLRDAARELMVQLRITIEKDGRVSCVVMEKGSGNRYFDESVLRAINKASPLPVPPERLRGAEDHYDVGFRFWGEGAGA